MIKKAIFGGTFDPIHNGHLHIAYEALYTLKLDKLIFMPSGNPPHKLDKAITDSYIRYEMVKIVTKDERAFEVSNYEINSKTINYTYKTMRHFKDNEPDVEWYFITGTDCLMQIDKWKNVNEIFDICKFTVFNRSGYSKENIMKKKADVEKKYDGEINLLNVPLFDISSSDIREKVSLGLNVSCYLKDGVYNTIKELGLYKNNVDSR